MKTWQLLNGVKIYFEIIVTEKERKRGENDKMNGEAGLPLLAVFTPAQ
jgi:hypothetical protein